MYLVRLESLINNKRLHITLGHKYIILLYSVLLWNARHISSLRHTCLYQNAVKHLTFEKQGNSQNFNGAGRVEPIEWYHFTTSCCYYCYFSHSIQLPLALPLQKTRNSRNASVLNALCAIIIITDCRLVNRLTGVVAIETRLFNCMRTLTNCCWKLFLNLVCRQFLPEWLDSWPQKDPEL